jgi:hypothetical protein
VVFSTSFHARPHSLVLVPEGNTKISMSQMLICSPAIHPVEYRHKLTPGRADRTEQDHNAVCKADNKLKFR